MVLIVIMVPMMVVVPVMVVMVIPIVIMVPVMMMMVLHHPSRINLNLLSLSERLAGKYKNNS